MTPIPVPTADDNVWVITLPGERPFLVILLAVIAGLALSLAVGWLLYKAGKEKHPTPLIVSLSILTALALVGALLGRDSDAYNLAAVGIGALAGSLATVYRIENEKKKPPPDDISKEDDDG
jgi:NhaP-type Na+/H+ or K+/H+ antiporter